MSKRRRMSYIEVLRLAKKPSTKELWLFIKLTFLGIGVLGVLAFVIKLIFSYIWMAAR